MNSRCPYCRWFDSDFAIGTGESFAECKICCEDECSDGIECLEYEEKEVAVCG